MPTCSPHVERGAADLISRRDRADPVHGKLTRYAIRAPDLQDPIGFYSC